MTWHCRQIADVTPPVVVCEREDLRRRIFELEELFIEAACAAGWNDKTQREALGQDAWEAHQ